MPAPSSTCICGHTKPDARRFFCVECFVLLPPEMRALLKRHVTASTIGGQLYEDALAWLGAHKARLTPELVKATLDAFVQYNPPPSGGNSHAKDVRAACKAIADTLNRALNIPPAT